MYRTTRESGSVIFPKNDNQKISYCLLGALWTYLHCSVAKSQRSSPVFVAQWIWVYISRVFYTSPLNKYLQLTLPFMNIFKNFLSFSLDKDKSRDLQLCLVSMGQLNNRKACNIISMSGAYSKITSLSDLLLTFTQHQDSSEEGIQKKVQSVVMFIRLQSPDEFISFFQTVNQAGLYF